MVKLGSLEIAANLGAFYHNDLTKKMINFMNKSSGNGKRRLSPEKSVNFAEQG